MRYGFAPQRLIKAAPGKHPVEKDRLLRHREQRALFLQRTKLLEACRFLTVPAVGRDAALPHIVSADDVDLRVPGLPAQEVHLNRRELPFEAPSLQIFPSGRRRSPFPSAGSCRRLRATRVLRYDHGIEAGPSKNTPFSADRNLADYVLPDYDLATG